MKNPYACGSLTIGIIQGAYVSKHPGIIRAQLSWFNV